MTHKAIGVYELKFSQLNPKLYREIREDLAQRRPFIILRGCFDPERIDGIQAIAQDFIDCVPASPRQVHAGMKDDHRLEDSDKDPSIFRKKKMRLIHFYDWNERYPGLQRTLQDVFAIRDALSDLTPERLRHFYTPIQCLHYPKGGGWLEGHVDGYIKSPKLRKEEELNYNVLVLSCGEKGKHFKTGGLYGTVDGERVPLEEAILKGDLVLFNQNVWHGVDPIDPAEKDTGRLTEGKNTVLVTPFPRSRIE